MIKKALVIVPAIVIILVGFYFIFATSPYVRYWADDFCTASSLNRIGFLGSQVSTWNTWTGRYSATFFISLFELLGPWVVRALPVILLAFILLSLKRFYKVDKILLLLFIFLILVNTPNIIQSFYWQTGALNYLTPFIFLNVFLGLVIFPAKKLNMFLPAILLFIAGGFSEAYALAQFVLVVLSFFAIKLTRFPKNDERLRIVVSGLIGSVLALGFIFVAPGNAVRATTVTQPQNLIFVVKSTLLGTKWYLLRMLSIKPFIYSLLLLFTAILVLRKRIKIKVHDSVLLGLLSMVAAILITAAVIGSGFYSMATIPPERALFIIIYATLLCFAFFSFAVVTLIKPTSKIIWVIAIINIITSFFLIKSVISNWTGIYKEVKTYALTWDVAEKELPLLKNINPVGGLDSFTDNGGWVASCVASYYNFSDVKLQPYDGRIAK